MTHCRPARILALTFAVLWGWPFSSAAHSETVLKVGADWNYLRKICFSPDGEIIAAAVDVGERKTAITLWKRSTAEPIAQFEIDEPHLEHLLFSPDGQRLVSSHLRSWDRTCRIWNVEEKALERRLADKEIWIGNVAFSPDGKRLVTGNADRTIKAAGARDEAAPSFLAGLKQRLLR